MIIRRSSGSVAALHSRSCGHSPEPYHSTDQTEHRQVRQCGFLVARGNAAVVLDLVNEPLDQIAFLVQMLVVRDGLRSRAARWDHRLGAELGHGGAKFVGIIPLVGEHVFGGKAIDQSFGLADVVDLPRGQNEADRIAEGIDTDIDFGAQAAARTPDRLILVSPFLAPAAC